MNNTLPENAHTIPDGVEVHLDDDALRERLQRILDEQAKLAQDNPEFAGLIRTEQARVLEGLEADLSTIPAGSDKNSLFQAALELLAGMDEIGEVSALASARLESAEPPRAPFSVGYKFRVTGGQENLKNISSWRNIDKAQTGQVFEVTGVLPNKGRFSYVSVRDEQGRAFALCTNDLLQQEAITPDEKPVIASEGDELGRELPTGPSKDLRVVVNTPDTLRNLDHSRASVRLSSGSEIIFRESLGKTGTHQYWKVEMPETGQEFKLCVTDTLTFTPKSLETDKPPVEVKEGEAPVVAAVLPGNRADLPPEAYLDLLEVEEPPKDITTPPEGGFNGDLVSEDGTINAEGAKGRIESVIPWGVNEAFITLSEGNTFNRNVPKGQKLRIVRENGTFVFADPEIKQLARSDGRVRTSAQDTLAWDNPDKPEATEEAVTTHKSIIATVLQEKADWSPRALVPESLMEDAVCAAFVQNYLSSTLGMDFMLNSGLIKPGQPTPDAWEMVRVLEESGHGSVVSDLSRFFEINSANRTIRLNEKASEYPEALNRFVASAFGPDAELGLVTFHYKHTATNDRILSSDTSTLNSHVTVNLGVGERKMEPVSAEGTGEKVADHIINNLKARLGKSFDNSWEANRDYLGYLQEVVVVAAAGIKVELKYDKEVQNFVDPEGNVYELQAGDQVVYKDVQLAHFYHNSDKPGNDAVRMDGLTELLIQGNFEPVGVVETNGIDDKISGRLEEEETGKFIIDQVEWKAEHPPTLEGLTNFYKLAYQEAVDSGKLVIPEEFSVDGYAERAAKYCYYYTFKSLLNLESGGCLPKGTKLPLLDWQEKPGKPVQVEDEITPEVVVASEATWMDTCVGIGKGGVRAIRSCGRACVNGCSWVYNKIASWWS